MNKSVSIILVVFGIAVLWGALASINAGIIGLGVILAVLALLDIVNGEFTGSNKMVWLTLSLAALFFAVIGIGSEYLEVSIPSGVNPVYTLSAVISVMLPVAYFIIGRRQKTTRGK